MKLVFVDESWEDYLYWEKTGRAIKVSYRYYGVVIDHDIYYL